MGVLSFVSGEPASREIKHAHTSLYPDVRSLRGRSVAASAANRCLVSTQPKAATQRVGCRSCSHESGFSGPHINSAVKDAHMAYSAAGSCQSTLLCQTGCLQQKERRDQFPGDSEPKKSECCLQHTAVGAGRPTLASSSKLMLACLCTSTHKQCSEALHAAVRGTCRRALPQALERFCSGPY